KRAKKSSAIKRRRRYILSRAAGRGSEYFGLSNKAIKQARYRRNRAAGLTYFEGLGAIEPGLVQHVLLAVTHNKLPVIAGVHRKDTLQRVLTDHLRNEWAEAWREEWLACSDERAPQMLQPCADHPSTSLWFWF